MPFNLSQINRRTRERIFFAWGILSLALWLLMATAEVCPPFHAWLHGGSIPDDDNCAVVAIALGHFDSATAEVPPVVPVYWVEVTPRAEISVLVLVDKHLSQSRAPPFCSAS